MRTLSYYYSALSQESDGMREKLRDLTINHGLGYLEILVDGDKELEARFNEVLPVVLVGPYQLSFPFSITEVEVAIQSTFDKDKYLNNETETPGKENPKFSGFESFSLWFSNQYPWVISVFLFLYSFIPFLAPVLQNNGNSHLATVIYKTYSILCHQLAFRSYFIGGEQPFYPRELANVKGYLTYEEVTGYPADDIETARNFIGNSRLGYKIAMCERDLAIYISMTIISVAFAISRKKLKRIPWYLWFIISIIPIGFDGVSQLPGLAANLPLWMPVRESTPFLRTITGILFGGGTAWFMYPLIEETVKDTRFQLQRKLQVVNYLDGKPKKQLHN